METVTDDTLEFVQGMERPGGKSRDLTPTMIVDEVSNDTSTSLHCPHFATTGVDRAPARR